MSQTQWVLHLTWSGSGLTLEKLKENFSNYDIINIVIINDGEDDDENKKGNAFLSFKTQEDAENAKEDADGKVIDLNKGALFLETEVTSFNGQQ
ncbi:MAG: hypothetical protein EZS28_023119 [Streblomastix strix]|uniref:RRM domain-containing protein n=1 Tax=Streblomastix strix TaxID=222440 RepID=A0A5J4VFU9_9EUKA|nr:MAG: hypothetical protein EZS28_023119 [Streblomastix strix]